ncbi:hypothetical protein scyTo_0023687, partial [Scyliorhinus torazame]|nr:hypothetical protein [Scyliorhinus torazame]
ATTDGTSKQGQVFSSDTASGIKGQTNGALKMSTKDKATYAGQ